MLSSFYYSYIVPDAVVPELVKESHISFLDLDTYELAYQISVRDYAIFRNVLPTDYIIDTFKRKQSNKSNIKNMNSLEDLVNDEMFWVMHEGILVNMSTVYFEI